MMYFVVVLLHAALVFEAHAQTIPMKNVTPAEFSGVTRELSANAAFTNVSGAGTLGSPLSFEVGVTGGITSTPRIDAVARDMIDAAGHGEHFGHGLGHGVGLEIHEGPRLARSGHDALEPGNVVTGEPGVYLPGRGGVRIEDLVVLTENGRDVLTGTVKALTTVS